MENVMKQIREKYPGPTGTSTVRKMYELKRSGIDLFNVDNVELLIRNKKTGKILINSLRGLEMFGYDVSEYKSEITLYDNFCVKYIEAYGRRNIQDVFFGYYKPLKNRFSDITTIKLAKFIEFLSIHKFPMLKILENILIMEGAPQDVQENIILKGSLIFDVSEIRGLLRQMYIDNGELFKKSNAELSKIVNELPCELKFIHTLSFEKGLEFITSKFKHVFQKIRMEILRVSNWPFIVQADETIKLFEKKRDLIESLHIFHPTRILFKVEQTLKLDLLTFQNDLTLEDLVNKLNSSSHVCYNVISQLTAENPKFRNLELYVDPKIVGFTIDEYFRKTQDEWSVKFMEDIIINIRNKSEYHTSVMDIYIKKITYNVVSILNSLIEFIDYQTLEWFMHNSTLDMLKKFIIWDAENKIGVQNERVKNQHEGHHAKRRVGQVLRIFRSDVAIKYLQVDPNLLKLDKLMMNIDNKRELNSERRIYTDDEVDSMMEVVQNDKKWTAILTIFREIGLRCGAVCNLKFSDMVDKFFTPRHEGQALEKGNKIRKFILGPNLKRKILSYISDYQNLEFNHKTTFLFNIEKNTRLPASSIGQRLKIIGKKAGLEVNVHPHLFRHTLVGKLEIAGNSINVISKFMGHSNVDTTQKWYSIRPIEEIVNNMKNPFYDISFDEEEYQDELERSKIKLETCINIISGIVTNISINERLKIMDLMPDLDRVMRNIVDSCAGSTTTDAIKTLDEENPPEPTRLIKQSGNIIEFIKI